MKFIVTVFTSSLLISFAVAHSLRGHITRSTRRSAAHAIPSNVQTLFNTVKNGGCQKFVGNNHNLGDGQGNSGEVFFSRKSRPKTNLILFMQVSDFALTSRTKDLFI
jgi:hypothetical protein